MHILIALYLAFLQIGLFGFGGGYAMISLIQQVLESHGWLEMEKFVDIVAIAEMTPGPIAVNSATFVGMSVTGFWGAALATAGVITPSFVLVLLLAHLFGKTKDMPVMATILRFLRPVIVGLVFLAAFTIGKYSIVDWKTAVLASGLLFLLMRTKIHPLYVLAIAGAAGIFLY